MATRKKVAPKGKPAAAKEKPEKKTGRGKKTGSGIGRFFRVIISTPVRQIILVAVIVVVLAVLWEKIEQAIGDLIVLFGWGLVFIVAAIIGLIVMIWRRKFGAFFRHLNRWLGGVAYALAVWGIISFFPGSGILYRSLGGDFGREIIFFPAPEYVGVLSVLALVIVGTVLVAPRACGRVLQRFFAWVARQTERQPAPRRTVDETPRQPAHRLLHPRVPSEEKPPLPPEMEEPTVPPELAASRAKLEALAKRAAALNPALNPPPEPKRAEPRQPEAEAGAEAGPADLRQVADDVWKKYGQAPDLVTVDGWRLPPVDILDVTPEVSFSQADNTQRAQLIEEALASYGVDAKVVQINAGPTVTQFGVEPGWDRKFKEIKEKDEDGNIQVKQREVSKTRVKVERISSLANDLALALAAPSIRIEAPVPGKAIVGVEVPNTTSDMVSLRGVIETNNFQKQLSKSNLAVALGKGAGGETVAADLAKMPHLLIAGATGSGKTVCLNTIVCCLLMNNTPNDLRFIMVDPKRVELTPYNSIPHLATPVIVDPTKALSALRWLSQEMDERYKKLAESGARHIEGYNKKFEGEERLPYLVLVIDELADLMMTGFDEVEGILCRLAQLARATGIHLVVATQRPSVDVITGLIKANFPTRISFAVTSQVDSRTILDSVGAEKLLGRGDMLFLPTDAAKPRRLQGCFLSDAEMERLVYFWGSQKSGEPDRMKMETLIATAPANTIGGHPIDPLLEQAKELARNYENVSTSFLQRKLHIGYPRAARLMEQLEEAMAKDAPAPEEEPEEEEDFTEPEDEDDILGGDKSFSG